MPHQPLGAVFGSPVPRALCYLLVSDSDTNRRVLTDLVWLWRHYRDGGGLDTPLVRRLAVLKIWVDAHGLAGGGTLAWKPGHEAFAFVPARWLRIRNVQDFDSQDIGQLSTPAPDLDALACDLSAGYQFLNQLTPEEATVAALDARDRPLVLRMLADLPTSRLTCGLVW